MNKRRDPSTETVPEAANAQFGEDGRLRSSRFDDIYFSVEDGLAETRHVFIDSLALDTRSRNHPERFRVAELGFGTGLNFLATVEHWLGHAPDGKWLDYIGVERYPLPAGQIHEALEPWAALAALRDTLLRRWPGATGGRHLLYFPQWRVRLLLIFNDVEQALAEIPPASVDAWYLDGFAPSRNPEMWTAKVLRGVRQASAADATIATFTAAGHVRRELQSLGFHLSKRRGFGRKREMLRATLRAHPEPTSAAVGFDAAVSSQRPRSTLVVGAGIAGLTTALALQQRGCQVRLLESGSAPAQGASGNPAGAVYPLITADASLQSRFSLMAFDYLRDWLANQSFDDPPFTPSGVMMYGFNETTRERYRKAAQQPLYAGRGISWIEDPAATSKLTGLSAAYPGLWLPEAGWLNPIALLQQLSERFQNAGGELIWQCGIKHLHQVDAGWRLVDHNGRSHRCDHVVWCTGATPPPIGHGLPLQPIRGAISQHRASNASRGLRCVVCHKGYLLPADAGDLHLSGARYHRSPWPAGPGSDQRPALWPDDHRHHQALLRQYLPDAELHATAIATGRGSWRMTTADRLPVVGPLVDQDRAAEQLAPYLNGSPFGAPSLPVHAGLWINSGHGSRGLTHAALCAEIIADSITGLPPLLPEDVRRAIHPARFLLRSLRRNDVSPDRIRAHVGKR